MAHPIVTRRVPGPTQRPEIQSETARRSRCGSGESREALVDALVRDASAALGVIDGEALPAGAVGAAELLTLVAGQDTQEGEQGGSLVHDWAQLGSIEYQQSAIGVLGPRIDEYLTGRSIVPIDHRFGRSGVDHRRS